MSTVKNAISFRELRDEIVTIAARAFDTPRDMLAEELMELVNRIDTEALTYGRAPSVPGLDDAHKMPSRMYWRYEFAGRILQGILSNEACLQRAGVGKGTLHAVRLTDELLEALEADL